MTGLGAPWSIDWAGRWDEHVFESVALQGNRPGDPSRRPLWVYLPPGYDGSEPLPVVYQIQGYTGQLDMWRSRSAFRWNFVELMDIQFARGECPPAIVVFVDCWTSVGGSQFLDSPALGNYHTYLCDEVVPWVDERYATLASREHRAIAGKSSGGYGAMVTTTLRPDLFGALATHAGDALFDTCYVDMFPRAARALRDHYDGSYEAFWEDFRSRPAFSKGADRDLVEPWGYAAAYSSEPDGTVLLPFDTVTGELIPEVWERWLAWDPVRMAREPRHQETLRGLRGIWIDAGNHDEAMLDLGAEAFRRAVSEAGVADERIAFEIFDAGHLNIEYRYPISLRYLAERLQP